jgi:glycosyltransferase involved in cell wall biosynthesis
MVDGRAFRSLINALQPDILHAHGLGFPRETAALGSLAPSQPLLLQDHANRPPRFWRRGAWRRGLAQVDAVAFCAREQAQPFFDARVLSPGVMVFEYPGTSSSFSPGDQSQARATTGLHGDPCLLWVGHLNTNKDPLTILQGFRECIPKFPDAHLWCCFGSAPLMDAVQSEIARLPSLAGRVHLLGKVPHDQVEAHMRAADFFVLGSHVEGSGFSLIEAMACGLPPVVSDTPSFRALTHEGAVGSLWRRGDGAAFARALLAASAQPRLPARRNARAHFERELSAAAGGRKLRDAYAQMMARRTQFSAARLPA